MKSVKSDGSSQLKDAASSFQKAAPYINIAYMLIASILLVGALGWWLDAHFMTKPIFTVIGIFCGLFLGFYNLFKVVQKMGKE